MDIRNEQVIEQIRNNLKGCDTEENTLKQLTIKQMAYMLMVIHHLVKEKQ